MITTFREGNEIMSGRRAYNPTPEIQPFDEFGISRCERWLDSMLEMGFHAESDYIIKDGCRIATHRQQVSFAGAVQDCLWVHQLVIDEGSRNPRNAHQFIRLINYAADKAEIIVGGAVRRFKIVGGIHGRTIEYLDANPLPLVKLLTMNGWKRAKNNSPLGCPVVYRVPDAFFWKNPYKAPDIGEILRLDDVLPIQR